MFARWLSRHQTIKRREVRRQVKENFDLYDVDKSACIVITIRVISLLVTIRKRLDCMLSGGILDFTEFKSVLEKSRKELDLDGETVNHNTAQV